MAGRKISYGFIFEARLQFLEDLMLGVSEVSHCTCLGEEFLESGFGVWSLGLCFHCQVLGSISTVSVDVCLEERRGYSAKKQVLGV